LIFGFEKEYDVKAEGNSGGEQESTSGGENSTNPGGLPADISPEVSISTAYGEKCFNGGEPVVDLDNQFQQIPKI
jgi:hypothetical protein